MGKLLKMKASQIQLSGIHQALLQTQANGLTGHIDQVWEDLGSDSAWLGGTKEAWERGPYYLDGLVEIAFLLKDEVLLKKINRWIDAICDSQEVSGFFGPKSNQDWWPRIIATKALLTYYFNTTDKRIIFLLERFFCYMEKKIDEQPLYFWAHVRGMEMLPALEWVIKETNNQNCSNLLAKIQKHTHDWEKTFQNFPYLKKTKYYLNRPLFLIAKPLFVLLEKLNKNAIKTKETIIKSQKSKNNQQFLLTHGVNIAMAIKYLAYTNSSVSIKDVLKLLQKYHGNVTSVFSSDEHLNGASPKQGMELCTTAELLYSLEEVMRCSGDLSYGDQIEWIATNILPAYFTHDMCAHQYVQQVNQESAGIKKGPFFDVGKKGTMFGIAPHFGCCAANMHQAFPKYFSSAVLYNQNTLYFAFYISGQYQLDGSSWQVKTDYPFSDHVRIKFGSLQQKQVCLRIPYSAKTTITIDGNKQTVEGKSEYKLNVKENSCLELDFDFQIEKITNPSGMDSIKRGPILFAQALDVLQYNCKGNPPYQDRVFKSRDKMIIPFDQHHQLQVIDILQQVNQDSFYDSNVVLKCRGKDAKTNQEKEVTLEWYGRTILRFAEWENK